MRDTILQTQRNFENLTLFYTSVFIHCHFTNPFATTLTILPLLSLNATARLKGARFPGFPLLDH